jgi:hypothetical protein
MTTTGAIVRTATGTGINGAFVAVTGTTTTGAVILGTIIATGAAVVGVTTRTGAVVVGMRTGTANGLGGTMTGAFVVVVGIGTVGIIAAAFEQPQVVRKAVFVVSSAHSSFENNSFNPSSYIAIQSNGFGGGYAIGLIKLTSNIADGLFIVAVESPPHK